MTKWDKIPQEVLQQILKLLDYRNVFQVTDEWPLVNRQWYSTYQSFAYKEIVVDLDLTFKHNVKARNILNCVDQPGLLVKSITLDNTAYTLVYQPSFDDRVELFYKFMLKTLNVRYIKLTTDEGSAGLWWKYLEKFLPNSSNTWKLFSIEMNNNNIRHPTSYFACVSQVKPTLEVLTIAGDMLEGRHLSQLYEFVNLTTLRVYQGLLRKVQELCELMKHFPRLIDVQANLSRRAVVDGNELALASRMISNYHYPNIRHMSLKSYAPTSKNELDSLMHSFPNINDLLISGSELTDVTWPSSIDSRQHLVLFLQHLDTLANCSLTMNVDDPVELLKNYYKSNSGSHVCNLWLELHPRAGQTLFQFKKYTPPAVTELTFAFGILQENQEAQKLQIMNVLSCGNKVIREIGIYIASNRIPEREIAIYLKTLIERNSYGNIRRLILRGGRLHDPASLSSIPFYCHFSATHIKSDLWMFWNQHLQLYLVTSL